MPEMEKITEIVGDTVAGIVGGALHIVSAIGGALGMAVGYFTKNDMVFKWSEKFYIGGLGGFIQVWANENPEGFWASLKANVGDKAYAWLKSIGLTWGQVPEFE